MDNDVIQKKVSQQVWETYTKTRTKNYTALFRLPVFTATSRTMRKAVFADHLVTNSDEINIKLDGQEHVE